MKQMLEVLGMAMDRLERKLPVCPKCGAEDSMEHRKVRVPDAPLDADWDECVVCNYQTQPE